jgi:CheY-like chemotaxis protein/anti-sigma regulatory factor (Ser/Thr protein kinase)
MAREKDLEFIIVASSLRVRSDANLLRRLVQNLVSNAIKYTISGKILIGARRKGNDVVIEVLDSGIGIPSTKFKTVFKEFARLDEGARTASGLGLGLSIVDRISRVLSHPVELSSVQGRGTIFRVTVPRDLAATQTTRSGEPQERRRRSQPLNGLKVLCIDNEAKILEGMALLISGWGCTVGQAGSLTDIDTLIASDEPPPEVVVADYHLGDGNGVEAIRRIRLAYKADIPALLITADRTPELRAEAERDDIAIQHKPVRPAALRAYLTHVAGIKRIAAE